MWECKLWLWLMVMGLILKKKFGLEIRLNYKVGGSGRETKEGERGREGKRVRDWGWEREKSKKEEEEEEERGCLKR